MMIDKMKGFDTVKNDNNSYLENVKKLKDDLIRDSFRKLPTEKINLLSERLERDGLNISSLNNLLEENPETFGLLNEFINANNKEEIKNSIDKIQQAIEDTFSSYQEAA